MPESALAPAVPDEPNAPIAPIVRHGGGVLERAGMPSAIVQAIEQAASRSQQGATEVENNLRSMADEHRQITQSLDDIPHTPAPKFEEIPEAPDTQKPTDALRVFGQVLPVLAMLGGVFVRNNSAAALQAGAAAMNAARENDATALTQAHQQWTDRLQAIRARNESTLQQWNAVVNDEHMSREDKIAHLNAIAASSNIEIALQHAREGSLENLIGYGQMYQNAHHQLTQEMAEQERVNIQRENASAMSPSSIDYYATQLRLTHQMPQLGMGAAAAALRIRVANRAAEMAAAEGSTAEADVWRQMQTRATQSALTQMRRQQTMVGSFERAARANLAIAQEYAGRVDRTGIPVLNRWVQAGQREIAGDADVAAFHAAVNTFVNEYAKIMSGSTGAAGSTDSARHEAMSMLSTAHSPSQFNEIVSVMVRDMDNRAAGFVGQEAELHGWATQGAGDSAVSGYDANDPTTWTPAQRQQWLAEHPE